MTAPELRRPMPPTIYIAPTSPCIRDDDFYVCDPKYLGMRSTEYTRTDLTIRRYDPVLKRVMASLKAIRRRQDNLDTFDAIVDRLTDEALAALQELMKGGAK